MGKPKTTRREFLAAVGTLIASRSAFPAGTSAIGKWPSADGTSAEISLPNIVYILADDLGYGDVSCQNPRSKISTPNLDRFAAEGVRFTDAHDPTAVCTPTRYGILTGRYCWRSSLKRGVLGGFSPPLIEPSRLTVPEMLRRCGYATACIGKWHLGIAWPRKNPPGSGDPDTGNGIDFSLPILGGPRARGFDYFFGLSASLDMPPYVFIENDRTVALPTAQQEKQGFVRNGPKDPRFKFENVLRTLTEKTVQTVVEHVRKNSNRPFFLYVALNAPHTPVVPRPEFHGKSLAGDYGDFVVEVDWAVGEILQALGKQKLADRTLVFFTSDNGPERIAYERARQYRHYSMGELRGVKRDAWEGGHRVPFMARWPGRIRPGSISNEIVCQTDLMATLAAVSGMKLPDDAGEDSYNILPALLGLPLNEPIREATVFHSASGKFAIRQGNWVLIDAPSGDDNQEPDWFKLERDYRPHDQPVELYDLRSDIGERRNLYSRHPEIAGKLKALLEKYKSEGRSTPRQRAVRVDGRGCERRPPVRRYGCMAQRISRHRLRPPGAD